MKNDKLYVARFNSMSLLLILLAVTHTRLVNLSKLLENGTYIFVLQSETFRLSELKLFIYRKIQFSMLKIVTKARK
jgi:hypothetical protein